MFLFPSYILRHLYFPWFVVFETKSITTDYVINKLPHYFLNILLGFIRNFLSPGRVFVGGGVGYGGVYVGGG